MVYNSGVVRKSVAALMTFMIFTLSLACTMSVCPAMAQNAKYQYIEGNDTPPCHGEESSDDGYNGGPMLSSDCLGIDLFHADTNLELLPDLTIDHIDLVWVNLAAIYDIRSKNAHGIRGPPFPDPTYFDSSSQYLTTQRLRI